MIAFTVSAVFLLFVGLYMLSLCIDRWLKKPWM